MVGAKGNRGERLEVETKGILSAQVTNNRKNEMFEVQQCQGPSQPDASTLAWTWRRMNRVWLTLSGHEIGLRGVRKRWRLPKG